MVFIVELKYVYGAALYIVYRHEVHVSVFKINSVFKVRKKDLYFVCSVIVVV